MSNHGKHTKTFIAFGKYSEKALSDFNNTWEYGFVKSINLPQQSSDANAVKTYSPKQPDEESSVIMVIDNDIASIKRAIDYIEYIHQIYTDIWIDIAILIDVIESIPNKTLLNSHKELEKSILNKSMRLDCMHVMRCAPSMIKSLISMCAHLCCGYSWNCINFHDIYVALSSGYYFEDSKIMVKNLRELPLIVEETMQSMPNPEGIILVIIAPDVFNLSIWSACMSILAGFIDDGDDFSSLTNIACYCNIQPGNARGFHLGVAFNKLPTK